MILSFVCLAKFVRTLPGPISTIFFIPLLGKLKLAQKICNYKTIVAAGGVASNEYIRSKIKNFCTEKNLNVFFPKKRFCTDNAAMIAWAAIERSPAPKVFYL